MDTVARQPMYGWDAIPWAEVERNVFKLQKRIYRASCRNDLTTVHNLQRLLTRSRSAKLLATRRVTQDNRGKKTPGIDGVKSLTPQQRLAEVRRLDFAPKAKPTRRVWIPKPGKAELRPLGIPTIRERALQTLARLALEPEWEAKFEPNSYGFRPGRSCWDAIEAVHMATCLKAKYALDADIASCFDRIDHTALLKKINTYSTLRRQIRAWLKAGVLDGGQLFPTEEGTPQGGALSPLLANIALHGMETVIRDAFPRTMARRYPPIVVRYADDLVVLHEDRQVIEQSRKILTEWLGNMGLELHAQKTKVVHTLLREDESPGFDFLGFHVRQYRVGKTKTARGTHGKLLGHKTLIRPSKEAVKRHSQTMSGIVDRHRGATQAGLIDHLNPVVRGWSSYYSTVSSKATLCRMDHILFEKLRAWALRRHPKKGRRWVIGKYWRLEDGEGWSFGPRGNRIRLRGHAATPIRRHTKVRGARSPYDGDWIYWSTRTGNFPGINKRVATLLKKQKGRCLWCGLFFRDDDLLEVDHIIPRTLGGLDAYHNWQLLHRHCHDAKTACDKAEQLKTEQVLAEIEGLHDKH